MINPIKWTHPYPFHMPVTVKAYDKIWATDGANCNCPMDFHNHCHRPECAINAAMDRVAPKVFKISEVLREWGARV